MGHRPKVDPPAVHKWHKGPTHRHTISKEQNADGRAYAVVEIRVTDQDEDELQDSRAYVSLLEAEQERLRDLIERDSTSPEARKACRTKYNSVNVKIETIMAQIDDLTPLRQVPDTQVQT